jgi:hypothetical protein
MECLNLVSRSNRARNVVIALTHGCTTCNAQNPQTYAQEALRDVTARNQLRHAQINAVCVGPRGQVCEAFPRALCQMNGGRFTRIVP